MKVQNKITKGKELPIPCWRIYVKKKEPIEVLGAKDRIPSHVKSKDSEIATDIVEIFPKALSVDKTQRLRPVPLGCSVGHWQITSGSLGMLFKYSGEIVAGSNAHVLTDDPSKEVEQITEKRILQPGAYFQGQNPDNIVGEYLWHKRVVPLGTSNCKVAKTVCKILNFLVWLFRRKGEFKYWGIDKNHIDFAVYYPTVEHLSKTADDSLTNEPFIGLLFAGDENCGVICKAKYMVEEGFTPVFPIAEVKEGDIVKGCSFWCNYTTKVTDSSAVIQVSYGDYIALFEDVIIVQNEDIIKGGWSGSGFRLIKSG
jgi:hypothetical protein